MENIIVTKIDNWDTELKKIKKYSKIDDCDLYKYYTYDTLYKLKTEYENKLSNLKENIDIKRKRLNEFQEIYNLIDNEFQVIIIKLNILKKINEKKNKNIL